MSDNKPPEPGPIQTKQFDQQIALQKAFTTLGKAIFALIMGAYLVLPTETITDFIGSLGINNTAVKMLLIGAALGVQRYYSNKSKNS